MEALSYRQIMILLEEWDKKNPDDAGWYRKIYVENLFKWLLKKGYSLIFEG